MVLPSPVRCSCFCWWAGKYWENAAGNELLQLWDWDQKQVGTPQPGAQDPGSALLATGFGQEHMCRARHVSACAAWLFLSCKDLLVFFQC